MLALGLIGIMGSTLLLTGMWSTVQFKWIQMRYPVVVLALERLLLVSSLVIGLVVQTFGIAGAIGIDTAPFYMVVMGCSLYALCMLPLPSSFEKTVGALHAVAVVDDGMVCPRPCLIGNGDWCSSHCSHYGIGQVQQCPLPKRKR